MKLLQKCAVIVVVLLVVSASISYAATKRKKEYTTQDTVEIIPSTGSNAGQPQPANQSGNDSKQTTGKKQTDNNSKQTTGKKQTDNNSKQTTKDRRRQGKHVTDPAPIEILMPKPELSPLEKITYGQDLTRNELQQAVNQYTLKLINWDFSSMTVVLCDTSIVSGDIKEGALAGLFTIADLEHCDFYSKSKKLPNADIVTYRLKLDGKSSIKIKAKVDFSSSQGTSMPMSFTIDGLNADMFKKSVICMIPKGYEWRAESALEKRVYDAGTGSRVEGKRVKKGRTEYVSFQGGTVVMFDSFEELIHYFTLRKSSR